MAWWRLVVFYAELKIFEEGNELNIFEQGNGEEEKGATLGLLFLFRGVSVFSQESNV